MTERIRRASREQQEGFVEIPPAVIDVKEQIVIPHSELHAAVKEKIRPLLRSRILKAGGSVLYGGMMALVTRGLMRGMAQLPLQVH